ncbi:MAG: hypothetical protein Tsb0020_36760 [Haliangiales bacterium]
MSTTVQPMRWLYRGGIDVDFDLSASDYRRYRPDYPPQLFVAATEALIAGYHSDWRHGSSDGVYPQALTDLGRAGFVDLESVARKPGG